MSANTPRSLFTTQNREARGVGGYAPTFSLAPDLIIGSTISNANTLSAAVDTNFFAFCAGSTVILAAVNARLGLDQRFFNAKPDASPSQITPSYYNPGTPTRASASRSYITSLPRDEVASGGVASGERSVDSSSRVKSAHRSRTLTCVAISPSGRLIAVGEVHQYPLPCAVFQVLTVAGGIPSTGTHLLYCLRCSHRYSPSVLDRTYFWRQSFSFLTRFSVAVLFR